MITYEEQVEQARKEEQERVERLTKLSTTTTEELEKEFSTLSEAIEANRQRFDVIRAELKSRRTVKDEQPPPVVRPASVEDALRAENERFAEENRLLILKVIEMEAEQAKFIVEAEVAKANQREADARLALVTKYYGVEPTKPAAATATASTKKSK